ncbi:hypothetical protein CJD36_022230 [Flavipsychrobacter stenotrophus]|uniref:Uncharacterized protein n=1 Tax=Flavipsychrobacter stenotrophus TaxID=2077091 RepID=A0A2S7SPM6_9BACT|nr:hypothetical protein CJD36_022230 [Flavipsychrobacter stenotrophus]
MAQDEARRFDQWIICASNPMRDCFPAEKAGQAVPRNDPPGMVDVAGQKIFCPYVLGELWCDKVYMSKI